MGVDLLDVNLARAAFFQNNDVHTAPVIKYTLTLNEQKGAKGSKRLRETDKKNSKARGLYQRMLLHVMLLAWPCCRKASSLNFGHPKMNVSNSSY